MKHLKLFEEYKDGMIKWDNLSNSVKHDIIENIYDNNEYVNKNYWNTSSLVDAINDSIYQPSFNIEYKNVDTLYSQFNKMNWGISEINLNKLIELLEDGIELDPIILKNGVFF